MVRLRDCHNAVSLDMRRRHKWDERTLHSVRAPCWSAGAEAATYTRAYYAGVNHRRGRVSDLEALGHEKLVP